MQGFETISETIRRYAISRLPEEACGYILREGEDLTFYSCTNVNENPRFNFTISAASTAKASRFGEIVALFHSHTEANYPSFSNQDLKTCNKGNIPWVLLKLPESEFKWLQPANRLPLLEREFVWGEQDCAALVRDIYAGIGIAINDYPRGELEIERNGYKDFAWNLDPTWNLYIDNFEKEGFDWIAPGEPIQKYDVILFNYEAPFGVANHAGVFMEPESNIFYHHLLGRLSERTIYGQGWRNLTIGIIRHKDLRRESDAHGDPNLIG